jgi:Periplasmic binding protein-like domain
VACLWIYVSSFRDAIKHPVDFGHLRIGYLSGLPSWSGMRTRFESLRKAMKLTGFPFDKELVTECDHTWEGGAQGMGSLLRLPKPPTAVLCCNDVATAGALRTLAARGYRAGKDISLIGFDNLTISQLTQPPLTTIQFSPRKLPGLAFRALRSGGLSSRFANDAGRGKRSVDSRSVEIFDCELDHHRGKTITPDDLGQDQTRASDHWEGMGYIDHVFLIHNKQRTMLSDFSGHEVSSVLVLLND